MSTEQPKPPEGYDTWFDYLMDDCDAPPSRIAMARAELAELRKELAYTKRIKEVACRDLETWQVSYDAAHKALEQAKAQLALQAANTVEAMAQRDAAQAERDQAVRERDSFKQHMQLAHFAAAETTQEREKYRHAARQFCGGHIGVSQSKCPACERNDLRAKVAELRGAILGLGVIDCAYENGDELSLTHWNEYVTRLRAEAKEAKS